MNIRRVKKSALSRLQEWYSEHCDADWEHSYGVKIDTLDNPGWMLSVDLIDTELSGLLMQRKIIQRTEDDWVQCEIAGDRYVACGGVYNLEEMIEEFLSFTDRNRR